MTKDEILSGYKEVYVYLEAPEKNDGKGFGYYCDGINYPSDTFVMAKVKRAYIFDSRIKILTGEEECLLPVFKTKKEVDEICECGGWIPINLKCVRGYFRELSANKVYKFIGKITKWNWDSEDENSYDLTCPSFGYEVNTIDTLEEFEKNSKDVIKRKNEMLNLVLTKNVISPSEIRSREYLREARPYLLKDKEDEKIQDPFLAKKREARFEVFCKFGITSLKELPALLDKEIEKCYKRKLEESNLINKPSSDA